MVTIKEEFMYVLAALLVATVVAPWLFICLTPVVLLVGSFVMVGTGIVKLFSKIDKMTGDQQAAEAMTKQKVLVVDDDLASVLPLIGLLQNTEADVNYVSSGSEMIEELKTGTYDIVFLDSRMPNMTGEVALVLGDQVLNLDKKQPVIFYSGHSSPRDMLGELKHFEVKDAWKKGDVETLQSNVIQLFTNKRQTVA
jgi:CheY-like chemotaxis protein